MSKLKMIIVACTAVFMAIGTVQAKDESGHAEWQAKRMGRMCSMQPDQARADKTRDRMIERLSLTDSQKPLLKDMLDAREKGRGDLKSSICADKPDVTNFAGKLNFQQKMAEGRVAMLKTTRPSVEAFYNSLDAGQKNKFTSMRMYGGGKKYKNNKHE